jgi:hypothetical protein
VPKDQRRKRGNDFQDWIEERLVAEGWSVHNQKTVSKAIPMKGKIIWVSGRNDILTCDLIAVKPGEKTLFIQATLDSGVKKRSLEMSDIGWEMMAQRVQLWQKREGGEVNIKEFVGTGFVEIGKIIRGKLYELGAGGV